MVETPVQRAVRPPRLNPFAFPSDTDFRFMLLIVSVIGASLFLYSGLYLNLPGTRMTYLSTHAECRQLAPSADRLSLRLLDPQSIQFVAAAEEYARCIAQVEVGRGGWMVAGVVALLITSVALYWALPIWKIRRERLAPLRLEDAPEVVAYLGNLCREAGLADTPSFVWNPLRSASTGLAFGRRGRYYLALTGGLVSQFYTDKPAFRAIVLHELAHLHNSDVDKTYFSVAIWRSFLLAALLPYVLSLAARLSENWDFLLDLGWRLFALAALVYLMRNAVLRVREVYADVRASTWDGPAGALRRMVEALPRSKQDRWLGGALQVHPQPAARLRFLASTDALFRLGSWDAFAAGLATTIAYANVLSLFWALASGANQFSIAPLLTALVFAPLIAGVVVVGTWRMTFAAQARGEEPVGLLRLGLSLWFGLILGQTLAFDAAVKLAGASDPASSLSLLGANIVWSALLLGGLVLFLRWVADGASIWLAVVATAPSPRTAYLAGFAIGGVVLALWLGMLFSMRFLLDGPLLPSSDVALVSVMILLPIWFLFLEATFLFPPALILLVLVSLWAFPLAAWLWRGDVASASTWAYLDPLPARPPALRQSSLNPVGALRTGLFGGLLYCALLLAVRIAWRSAHRESLQPGDNEKIVFYLATVGLAVVMQVGVAAVAAARAPRLGAPHGLFAAFLAGSTMALGFLVLNLLFSGSADPDFVWQVFSQILNQGALWSLPVVLIVSALADKSRQRRSVDAELQFGYVG